MKRLFVALLLAAILILPVAGQAAAESATISVSVTVLPSPLIVIIDPGCEFVIAAKTTKADCSTTITVAQPTFQFEGWQLLLAADKLINAETGQVIDAKSITIVAYSSFQLHWGQPVDKVGGPYIPKQAVKHKLDDPRVVIEAEPGFGIGGYTTTVHFEVKVDPHTTPGRYVPVMQTSVSNTYMGS